MELQNVSLFQALDYVSLLAKAYWKPLTENAIFVTNDNSNKRRDYQEEVVQTFYLTNTSTPPGVAGGRDGDSGAYRHPSRLRSPVDERADLARAGGQDRPG